MKADKEKARKLGRGFAYEIDIDIITTDDERYKGEITMDNQDFYYETDPYKDKECALAEVKGFLEGIKIRIDNYIERIDKVLENDSSM